MSSLTWLAVRLPGLVLRRPAGRGGPVFKPFPGRGSDFPTPIASGPPVRLGPTAKGAASYNASGSFCALGSPSLPSALPPPHLPTCLRPTERTRRTGQTGTARRSRVRSRLGSSPPSPRFSTLKRRTSVRSTSNMDPAMSGVLMLLRRCPDLGCTRRARREGGCASSRLRVHGRGTTPVAQRAHRSD